MWFEFLRVAWDASDMGALPGLRKYVSGLIPYWRSPAGQKCSRLNGENLLDYEEDLFISNGIINHINQSPPRYFQLFPDFTHLSHIYWPNSRTVI